MDSGRHIHDRVPLKEVIGWDIPKGMRLRQLCWDDETLTVGDVRRMSYPYLLRFPNVGRKCAARIRDFFGTEQVLDSANIADIPDVIADLRRRVSELESRVVWLETTSAP
jgi:hypothetical protein